MQHWSLTKAISLRKAEKNFWWSLALGSASVTSYGASELLGHPKFYDEAKVVCACGNIFTVGSILPEIRTDVCSKCNSFYTGKQRFADSSGRAGRFQDKIKKAAEIKSEKVAAAQKAPKEKKVTKKSGKLNNLNELLESKE